MKDYAFQAAKIWEEIKKTLLERDYLRLSWENLGEEVQTEIDYTIGQIIMTELGASDD